MLTSGAAVKRPHSAFTEQNIYFQAALYRKMYVCIRMRDAAARIDRGSEESRSPRLSGDWTSASVCPSAVIRAKPRGETWRRACMSQKSTVRNVVLCGFRGQVIMQAAIFRNSCFWFLTKTTKQLVALTKTV